MLSWSPSLYNCALLGPLPLTPVFLTCCSPQRQNRCRWSVSWLKTSLNALFQKALFCPRPRLRTWTALAILTTLKEALVQFGRKLPADLAQICTQGSTQEGRTALTSTGTDTRSWTSVPRKPWPDFTPSFLEWIQPPPPRILILALEHPTDSVRFPAYPQPLMVSVKV